MSAEQGTAAALAVAAAGAALLRKRGGKQPEKGGIYITESDRTTLLEKINQIASSTYYIDEDGYLREDKNAPVKEGGSKTYSELLSGMIDSNKKIILGRDFTYTAGEKEETIDGDGNYGQIEGELNLDWIYERQEEMKAASGSIFNFARSRQRRRRSHPRSQKVY